MIDHIDDERLAKFEAERLAEALKGRAPIDRERLDRLVEILCRETPGYGLREWLAVALAEDDAWRAAHVRLPLPAVVTEEMVEIGAKTRQDTDADRYGQERNRMVRWDEIPESGYKQAARDTMRAALTAALSAAPSPRADDVARLVAAGWALQARLDRHFHGTYDWEEQEEFRAAIAPFPDPQQEGEKSAGAASAAPAAVNAPDPLDAIEVWRDRPFYNDTSERGLNALLSELRSLRTRLAALEQRQERVREAARGFINGDSFMGMVKALADALGGGE